MRRNFYRPCLMGTFLILSAGSSWADEKYIVTHARPTAEEAVAIADEMNAGLDIRLMRVFRSRNGVYTVVSGPEEEQEQRDRLASYIRDGFYPPDAYVISAESCCVEEVLKNGLPLDSMAHELAESSDDERQGSEIIGEFGKEIEQCLLSSFLHSGCSTTANSSNFEIDCSKEYNPLFSYAPFFSAEIAFNCVQKLGINGEITDRRSDDKSELFVAYLSSSSANDGYYDCRFYGEYGTFWNANTGLPDGNGKVSAYCAWFK